MVKINSEYLFVLPGPAFSGKSTIIKLASRKLIGENKLYKIKLFENCAHVLLDRNLHAYFKIPASRALSEILPENSY